MHTINPNDRSKVKCVTMASMTVFPFDVNICYQYESIQRQQTISEPSDNKDCRKGERLIGNEDPCEKESDNNRGSPRGLTGDDKQRGVFGLMMNKTAGEAETDCFWITVLLIAKQH